VTPVPMPSTATHAGPPKLPCPTCGFLNDTEDEYCGSCRARLDPVRIEYAPPVTPPPPLGPGEIACPSCGAHNPDTRLFCLRCATPLRAAALPPPKQPFRLNRGMVLPFVLSAVIGLGATVGGARIGALVLARAPAPTAAPATPVTVAGPAGAPLGFTLTPAANPQPVNPLPDKSTIRLADYEQPDPSDPPGPDHPAKWWNDAVPRVPAVSQFDGGPLQLVNCVMATGAMLARLAFGIVTTGSQLRALQDDQEGASSYGDLDTALERGWGVSLLRGFITPVQLRALSYAGAGVAVALDYGAIPVGVRLQASFTGAHSVYIDAFRPAGPDGPAAYWVMDPIGRPWAGYHGGWWPAEDVERAGTTFGGGRIYATWAFAGGIVPDHHKVLPPNAYPTSAATAAPTAAPTAEPLPSGDVPPPDDPKAGTPPPDVPPFPTIAINTNVYVVDPGPAVLACTTEPVPAGCPGGIIGVMGPGGPGDPTTPPINHLDILYANLITPVTVQVVFDAPAGSSGQLWTWQGSGLPLIQSIAEPAMIGSTSVSVATIAVDTSGTFSFFATASGDSYAGLSTVGTLVVGS
jgi:hypothetical protein